MQINLRISGFFCTFVRFFRKHMFNNKKKLFNMKKIFTLCVVALMAVTTVKAQHEIGAVVGGLNGLSYKYWV